MQNERFRRAQGHTLNKQILQLCSKYEANYGYLACMFLGRDTFRPPNTGYEASMFLGRDTFEILAYIWVCSWAVIHLRS